MSTFIMLSYILCLSSSMKLGILYIIVTEAVEENTCFGCSLLTKIFLFYFSGIHANRQYCMLGISELSGSVTVL